MADPDIVIRAVAEGDIARLAEMIDTLSAHHGATTNVPIETLGRDLLGTQPWAHARVAVMSGTIVGYAIGCPQYFAQFGERGLHLHHLFVDPQHRGAGLGTTLTHALIDLARALSCRFVTVSAATGNMEAQRFYENLGMRQSPVTGMRYMLDL